jgi:hypothetical protein
MTGGVAWAAWRGLWQPGVVDSFTSEQGCQGCHSGCCRIHPPRVCECEGVSACGCGVAAGRHIHPPHICKHEGVSACGGGVVAGHRRIHPPHFFECDEVLGAAQQPGVVIHTPPHVCKHEGMSVWQGVRWWPGVVVCTCHAFASKGVSGVVRWPGVVVHPPHIFE